MKVSIQARVAPGGKDWVAICKGLSGEKIQQMGQDIVTEAQANVARMSFIQSEGALESEIYAEKTGDMSCRVSAATDHSSYIEFGTEFIKGKMPFLWPAYRSVKRAFFKSGEWL